jgi:hypothetical protein
MHSESTISSIIHEVTEAICAIGKKFVNLPTNLRADDYILDNYRFNPYFNRCDGAFDGTHIPAFIPAAEQGPFRSRKGITQNILGVVGFDGLFHYSLPGWEGSAHDGRVLTHARTEGGFRIRPGHFYLADAGYKLTFYCLTPYRGTRYHLAEWARNNQAPQNKEELFNLRHASARNIVERDYGYIKQRFPILTGGFNKFSFEFQCKVWHACVILFNIVRGRQTDPDYFDNLEEYVDATNDFNDEIVDDVDEDDEDDNPDPAVSPKAWRNSIAQSMWDAYILYRNEHVEPYD